MKHIAWAWANLVGVLCMYAVIVIAHMLVLHDVVALQTSSENIRALTAIVFVSMLYASYLIIFRLKVYIGTGRKEGKKIE